MEFGDMWADLIKKPHTRGFVAVWWARNETKTEATLGGLAETHIFIEKC